MDFKQCLKDAAKAGEPVPQCLLDAHYTKVRSWGRVQRILLDNKATPDEIKLVRRLWIDREQFLMDVG